MLSAHSHAIACARRPHLYTGANARSLSPPPPQFPLHVVLDEQCYLLHTKNMRIVLDEHYYYLLRIKNTSCLRFGGNVNFLGRLAVQGLGGDGCVPYAPSGNLN